MYVIVTTNLKLLVYMKKLNGIFLMSPQSINQERYHDEAMVTTTSKNLAMLALVDGAKVYETATMSCLIPMSNSKEELLDKIIDDFLEVIGIRKTSKGYEYIKYMLKCNVKDDAYCLKPMSKVVYPECAKVFGVSASTVAKHANEVIKNSYNRNALKYDVLYYKTHTDFLTEAPKVNNFVVVMADKLRKLLPEK